MGDATPVPIDDAEDPRVADYVGLADAHLRSCYDDIGPADPKGPGRPMNQGTAGSSPYGRFVAEGFLAVAALARSPYPMRSVLVSQTKLHRLADLGPLGGDTVVYVAPQAVLDRTAGFALHRGIVAVGERRPPIPPSELIARAGTRPLVVLEALNDHENLGVIFRNAAAFGAGGVLLDPLCADPLYRRCVRVSLGHVLAVPFARIPAASWPGILDEVIRAGYETMALSPGGNLALHNCDPTKLGPIALVAGAEGPGLSDAALAAANRIVRIELAPPVDSLNVGTAVAIALHWFTRPQTGR